ncbi:hypothetical protein FOA43_000726 [Brettanomyces nanus]|uniref:Uncharacterized protein n=1 Tax=Eeniella nana TaxID=13502 RepID=A0A875RWV0_EENNA|nr:uncharacterized protein FOA43_000726 [Brettanomyces nanus]QPG73416.1 hypothetical protein FOA43_000726 [Brettanomyces nanus]
MLLSSDLVKDSLRNKGDPSVCYNTNVKPFNTSNFKNQCQDPVGATARAAMNATTLADQTRGRHYQIPNRFKFRKNIPFTRSISLQMPASNPNIPRRDHPLKRQSSAFFSPLSSEDCNTDSLPLNQSKRHSISVLMDMYDSNHKYPEKGTRFTNPYDETKVPQTMTPSMRAYIFDSTISNKPFPYKLSPSLSLIDQGSSKITKKSERSSNSQNPIVITNGVMLKDIGQNIEHRKSILISGVEESNNPAFASSVSKINYYQGSVPHDTLIAQVGHQNGVDSTKEHSSGTDNLSLNVPLTHRTGTDESSMSLALSAADSVSSDAESDDDEREINIIGDDELTLDLHINRGVSVSSATDVEPVPMRTQQRQLAIKDMIDTNRDAGDAWLRYATADDSSSQGKESVLEDSIESLVQESKEYSLSVKNSQLLAIWSKVGITRRNIYEEITKNLRNMVMFSKMPVMEAIERYSKSTLGERKNLGTVTNTGQNLSSRYLGAEGEFSLVAGSQLSRELWCSANEQFKFDR